MTDIVATENSAQFTRKVSEVLCDKTESFVLVRGDDDVVDDIDEEIDGYREGENQQGGVDELSVHPEASHEELVPVGRLGLGRRTG